MAGLLAVLGSGSAVPDLLDPLTVGPVTLLNLHESGPCTSWRGSTPPAPGVGECGRRNGQLRVGSVRAKPVTQHIAPSRPSRCVRTRIDIRHA